MGAGLEPTSSASMSAASTSTSTTMSSAEEPPASDGARWSVHVLPSARVKCIDVLRRPRTPSSGASNAAMLSDSNDADVAGTDGNEDLQTLALTSMYDGRVYVWDVSGLLLQHGEGDEEPQGAQLATVLETGYGCPARGATFARAAGGGLRAIVGSDDGGLRVFDVDRALLSAASASSSTAGISEESVCDPAVPVLAWKAHSDYVRKVVAHPTLPLVLTAADDCVVKVWAPQAASEDAKSWPCGAALRGHQHYVMDVCVDPFSDRVVATGSLDMTVNIYSIPATAETPRDPVPSAAPLVTLRGHTKGVTAVTFLPYAVGAPTRLASASDDGTVRIWEVPLAAGMVGGARRLAGAPTCIAVLQGSHTRPLSALRVHVENKCLLSAGEDGVLGQWPIPDTEAESDDGAAADGDGKDKPDFLKLDDSIGRVWAVTDVPGERAFVVGGDHGAALVLPRPFAPAARDPPIATQSATAAAAAASATAAPANEAVVGSPPASLPASAAALVCPLTRQIMRDPVFASCGHAFERDAILRHVGAGDHACVSCGARLSGGGEPVVLVPARALRDLCNAHHAATGTTTPLSAPPPSPPPLSMSTSAPPPAWARLGEAAAEMAGDGSVPETLSRPTAGVTSTDEQRLRARMLSPSSAPPLAEYEGPRESVGSWLRFVAHSAYCDTAAASSRVARVMWALVMTTVWALKSLGESARVAGVMPSSGGTQSDASSPPSRRASSPGGVIPPPSKVPTPPCSDNNETCRLVLQTLLRSLGRVARSALVVVAALAAVSVLLGAAVYAGNPDANYIMGELMDDGEVVSGLLSPQERPAPGLTLYRHLGCQEPVPLDHVAKGGEEPLYAHPALFFYTRAAEQGHLAAMERVIARLTEPTVTDPFTRLPPARSSSMNRMQRSQLQIAERYATRAARAGSVAAIGALDAIRARLGDTDADRAHNPSVEHRLRQELASVSNRLIRANSQAADALHQAKLANQRAGRAEAFARAAHHQASGSSSSPPPPPSTSSTSDEHDGGTRSRRNYRCDDSLTGHHGCGSHDHRQGQHHHRHRRHEQQQQQQRNPRARPLRDAMRMIGGALKPVLGEAREFARDLQNEARDVLAHSLGLPSPEEKQAPFYHYQQRHRRRVGSEQPRTPPPPEVRSPRLGPMLSLHVEHAVAAPTSCPRSDQALQLSMSMKDGTKASVPVACEGCQADGPLCLLSSDNQLRNRDTAVLRHRARIDRGEDTDADARVSFKLMDPSSRATVATARAILPTTEQLQQADWFKNGEQCSPVRQVSLNQGSGPDAERIADVGLRICVDQDE